MNRSNASRSQFLSIVPARASGIGRFNSIICEDVNGDFELPTEKIGYLDETVYSN